MAKKLTGNAAEERARVLLGATRMFETALSTDDQFLTEWRRRVRIGQSPQTSLGQAIGSLAWKAAPVWTMLILVCLLTLVSLTSTLTPNQPTDQLFWTLAGNGAPQLSDGLILDAVMKSPAGRK